MTSDESLSALEKAAFEVLKSAKSTHGGVGMSCFLTSKEQQYAFERASAKENDAKAIVNMIAEFKAKHSDFK